MFYSLLIVFTPLFKTILFYCKCTFILFISDYSFIWIDLIGPFFLITATYVPQYIVKCIPDNHTLCHEQCDSVRLIFALIIKLIDNESSVK